MKLYYLANMRFPSERAHAVQIVHMAQAFAQAGLSTTLILPKRETDISEDAQRYHNLSSALPVQRLRVPFGPRWGMVGFLFQSMLLGTGAALAHRGDQEALFYSRDEWALFALSWCVPAQRLVWESHEAKYNLAARRLLRKGVSCIVISEGIEEFYQARGVPQEQLLVAHDAVDERFFAPPFSSEEARACLDISSTLPVLLYVGGFGKEKGIETLLAASEALEGALLLVIVGGREAEVATLRERHAHVRFLGAKPYRDLAWVQQAADVLVIPNSAHFAVSRSFTSPLKLFAHMTSGIPIVASRVPSIGAVLGEDEAFFFAPDDPSDLARAAKEAVNDREEAARRAQRAREKSKEYTWSARAKRIISFINHRL